MTINEIINERNITKYRLSKLSGVPNTTISDICSGKTSITKCSVETLYKISKVLDVTMEFLVEETYKSKINSDREKSFEYGLPEYLQHDLDEYKKGVESNSSLIDCLWGELYGSINLAEITDSAITHEQAEYLRNKYLWG